MDPTRRVLGGYSIGASFAYVGGCERPDLFSGLNPVAGGFWEPIPESCVGPITGGLCTPLVQQRQMPVGMRRAPATSTPPATPSRR